MNEPLVSIITPSFNQGKWLEETILSVLNQSYPHIEYIIIDGGSTDNSKQIIEKYAGQLTYWQSQPDGGQADALNIGFKKAKGDIIAYLNADDLLEPKAVEGIIHAYEVNQEFSIYYGKCKTIDAQGKLLEEGNGNQVYFKDLAKDGMLPNMYQPACFFNRAYLRRDSFVDSSLKYAFDYELILFLASTKSILFLNRDMASYRVHTESKSYLYKIDAYKEKLGLQEKYSAKNYLLIKWKRIKLALAEKTGKITNGNAAL
ncbi:MAG: glycosyltransferase [Sphingobacteriales bacterium]|jgi:glycosyltransferase involved in cell wall biosynthesis|nr:glycosyltransferase [Sphingobacteriales bacterium]